MPSVDTIDKLHEDLSAGDGQDRGKAALRLGAERSEESVPRLVVLLHDPDRGVAEAAAVALAEIGAGAEVARRLLPLLRDEQLGPRNLAVTILKDLGEAAVPHVAGLVEDEDPGVRLFALEILHQIGTPSVLGPILQALWDDNINVATSAANTLGQYGDRAAVPPLIRALDRPVWLRCAVIQSLGKLGGPEAVRALTEIPTSSEKSVLFSTVNALATAASPDAIPYLHRVIATADKAISNLAVQAVIRILDASYEAVIEDAAQHLGPEILVDFLRSDNPTTVVSAVRLLGRLEREDIDRSLLELFESDDEQLIDPLKEIFLRRTNITERPFIRCMDTPELSYRTKQAAVEILCAAGTDAAMNAVIAHLKYGDPGLRIKLLRSLAQFDRPAAKRAVQEQRHSSDEFVRSAVVDALDPRSSAEEFQAFVHLLGDDSRAVRRRIQCRSRKIMDRALSLKLVPLVDHGDEQVVESAIGALSGWMDSALIARLVDRLEGASTVLVVAILRTIAAHPEHVLGELRDRVDGLMARMLRSPEEPLRVAAVKAYGKLELSDRLELLFAALDDDDSARVRYEAALALKTCTGEDCVQKLMDSLDRASPYVMSAIVETLVQLGGTGVVEKLRELDTSNDAVLAEFVLESVAALER